MYFISSTKVVCQAFTAGFDMDSMQGIISKLVEIKEDLVKYYRENGKGIHAGTTLWRDFEGLTLTSHGEEKKDIRIREKNKFFM